MTEPVLAPLKITDRLDRKKTEEELQKYFQEQKGKLRGKIVLLEKPRDVTPVTTAPASRYSDADLAKEAEAPTPQALPAFDLEKMILPEKPSRTARSVRSAAAGCRVQDLGVRGPASPIE